MQYMRCVLSSIALIVTSSCLYDSAYKLLNLNLLVTVTRHATMYFKIWPQKLLCTKHNFGPYLENDASQQEDAHVITFSIKALQGTILTLT